MTRSMYKRTGMVSEFYCDRACHDGEPLYHDGDGGYYCELCELNPDSDDDAE